MSLLPSYVNVSCPYCGYKRSVQVELFKYTNTPVLVYCEGEYNDGGCDKHYVVRVHVTIEISTQMLLDLVGQRESDICQ
jgi:sarcosine oxidase delta subunit